MSAVIEQPKLDAPGAGLPKVELYVARLMFKRFRRKHDRESLNRLIEAARDETVALASGIDEEQGMQRVLIDRLRGLEDSSRFWSVFMTLEHVRIVNKAVLGIMANLAEGTIPDGEASTAAVKPAEEVGHEVIAEFSESCDRLMSFMNETSDIDRTETYAHPWFGPLTIRQWHAMATFHLELHLNQVKEILKAMDS